MKTYIFKLAVLMRIAGLVFNAVPAMAVVTAPAQPPSIAGLLGEVEQTMKKLGAPLELTPDELVYLNQAAMQLNDSKTGKPYETVGHHLLPYYVFDSTAPATPVKSRTVLFIGGIHADEIDPMYTAWHTILSLEAKKTSLSPGIRLIYAPLTNPDGLINATQLYGNPTRKNLHNVDLNRNFDFGTAEQETRFMMDLIADFHPELVVALHAPFDWLDYNGPAKKAGATPAVVQSVQAWLKAVQSAAGTKLPINADFEIYSGSMGEYVGKKLNTHILTFEYPTVEPSHAQNDWKLLGPAVLRSLNPPTAI